MIKKCDEALQKKYGISLDIKIYCGNQADINFFLNFSDGTPQFDLIIDDGGHKMNQQITSFNYLQRKVKSGGVIENLLSSYMPVYGGGYLLHSTTIEFIKHLVDDLQIACPIK